MLLSVTVICYSELHTEWYKGDVEIKVLRSGIAVETEYYFNRLLLPYLKCSKVAKSCSHTL